MALAMEGGGLRDLSAPNSARQDSASGPPPFSHSRLRGYASRVEGMLDPKIVLGSSVALTAAGIADPFPAVGGGSLGGSAPGRRSPRALAPPDRLRGAVGGEQQQQQQQAGTTTPASGQQHHARFAPAPASVLTGSPAGGGGLANASRFAPHSPEQLQRPPPAAPTAAWPPSPAAGAAAAAAASAAASPEELSIALSQIQALKAEIAGVETVLGYLKGSETSTTAMGRKAHKLPSQEQLRARADALAASRTAARLAGGGGAAATATSVDPLLLAPLRTSVGHGPGAAAGGSPARAKSAGETQASTGGGGMGGSSCVFDTLAAETKLGRTWRVPRGPQPVGRGEAVILEAALDEALPAGAITAKYGSGAAVELSFWSGGDVRQDFEMLEMVQRELARQVSVSCVERGRIIDKLADRHSEIFVAVAAAARAAAEAQRNLTGELARVQARSLEQASEIASLRAELASRGAEAEDLREQLAEATTAHEHHVWDTEQEVEQLQGQADILADEVEHLHVRLSEAVAEKDAALSRGLERLEADLEAVTDERDDLAQRIRFLERQLHKLRTEMNASAETVCAEVQTDPIDWGPVVEEDVPDDCSDTPSLAEIRARFASQGYGSLTPEERIRLGLPPHMPETNKEHKGRKRKRALGHFEGLISSEKPGRVRGLPWTMNAISAIYYDKLHADTVSDREGNPRLRLADFAVDWHMTRFGLRNLAEMHLLDLIASVRQHYKTSVRVRWFGQFTGLVEVGDHVDTTPHVSFYLAVLSALSAPNALPSLFPDTGGEEASGNTPPVALKAAALPEATRAVFRYLGEPEAAPGFLARAVDPLTDPASQLVPLDPLVALFMAEYQKRWERNAAHLRALFRAGDYDDDGLIGYDEFVAIVRQFVPEPVGERLAVKMYSDAVRRLPEGQSLLDADTFLAVARAFGWDRWRIDVGGTALSSSGSMPKPLTSHWSLFSMPSTGGAAGTSPPAAAAAAAPAAATTAAAAAAAGRTSSAGVLRTESALARGALAAGTASLKSMSTAATAALAAAGGSPAPAQSYTHSVSNLRKEESVVGLSDADRALLRVLDGALEGLDPPLEDQVTFMLDKLRAAVAAAQTQAAAAAAAVAAMPGLDLGPSARDLNAAIAADSALMAKLDGQLAHFRTVYGERTDPAAAWLAFRLLTASLAAATAGSRPRNSRSRPGSAKGSVGWAVTRSVMRLTVPPLPFRAGSPARPRNSGGGPAAAFGPGPAAVSTAAAMGSAPTSRGSPGSAVLGLGFTTAPNSGSLMQLLSGASANYLAGAGPAAGFNGASVETAAASPQSPRSPSSWTPRSRSPSKSPELLGARPVGGLAQLIQGSAPGSAPGGAGSFAERQPPGPLVTLTSTGPAPPHRAPPPLPVTVPGRTSALASAGAGGGVGTPTKRGVVFSLGTQPPPAQAGGSSAAVAVPQASEASASELAAGPGSSAVSESAAGPDSSAVSEPWSGASPPLQPQSGLLAAEARDGAQGGGGGGKRGGEAGADAGAGGGAGSGGASGAVEGGGGGGAADARAVGAQT